VKLLFYQILQNVIEQTILKKFAYVCARNLHIFGG